MIIRFLIFFTLFIFQHCYAQQKTISVSDSDSISGKLNQKIDLNLKFKNENGEEISLKNYLNDSSVLVLTLNYFRCTTMCTYQYLNLSEILKKNKLFGQNSFKVASISFDPTDTIQIAKQTKEIWTPKTEIQNPSWHFFVGNPSNISKLTNSLNFYTEKDDQGNYSHAAALFFIRPDGTFYRYLYGIVYDKSEFSAALYDSSFKALGGIQDWFYELFHTYHPERGKYLSSSSR
jgi:protein SCO1/2